MFYLDGKANGLRYTKQAVSIRELFESGETGEGSIYALYRRSVEGLLFQIAKRGRTRLFDKTASLIKLRGARECDAAGILWREILTACRDADITHQYVIGLLKKGMSKEEAINAVKKKISSRLDRYYL